LDSQRSKSTFTFMSGIVHPPRNGGKLR